MSEVKVSPYPFVPNVELIREVSSQQNQDYKLAEKQSVSKEVKSTGGSAMEYSMRDSVHQETQEFEEFELMEDSVPMAKKATVVWVEAPKTPREARLEILGQKAKLLKYLEATQE